MAAEGGYAAGKVALITGSSRGIGRALALSLAEQGASIVVNYKTNEEAAKEVLGEIEERGGKAVVLQADVESPEQIDELFDGAAAHFGRLDYFVDNAAASSFKLIKDLKLHHLDRSYAMNIRSFVLGAQRPGQQGGDGGFDRLALHDAGDGGGDRHVDAQRRRALHHGPGARLALRHHAAGRLRRGRRPGGLGQARGVGRRRGLGGGFLRAPGAGGGRVTRPSLPAEGTGRRPA